MALSDKEIREAFEATTNKNIKAVIQFTEDTRKLVRELENKVQFLQNDLISRHEEIKQLKIQNASILTKLVRGGTSG